MITRLYEIACNTCGCGQHFFGNVKMAESQFKSYGGIITNKKHYCDKECFMKSKEIKDESLGN